MAAFQSTTLRSWPVVLAGAIAGILVARRMRRFVVEDESMLPSLRPGDRLLVLALTRRGARRGDVVVVTDPERAGGWLVKRVAAVHADGSLELRGDNLVRSRDGRAFGPVPSTSVIGRAVWRYLPSYRRGWVR